MAPEERAAWFTSTSGHVTRQKKINEVLQTKQVTPKRRRICSTDTQDERPFNPRPVVGQIIQRTKNQLQSKLKLRKTTPPSQSVHVGKISKNAWNKLHQKETQRKTKGKLDYKRKCKEHNNNAKSLASDRVKRRFTERTAELR